MTKLTTTQAVTLKIFRDGLCAYNVRATTVAQLMDLGLLEYLKEYGEYRLTKEGPAAL